MKKVKFLLVSLISIFAFNINVFAASGSLEVSSSSVYIGDSFTVTANISSAAAWNVHVSASGPVSSCVINQADATADAMDTNKSFEATCTATGTGTITIRLSGDVTSASDGNAVNISGSKSVTVSQRPTPPSNNNTQTTDNRSKNNNIKELIIDGYELVKVDANNYTLSVSNDVTSINIKAIAEDSKSKITGSGNRDINVGENNIEIVVTAENGSQNKINIKVTRKDGYYLEDLDSILKNNKVDDINITIKSDTKLSSGDLEMIKDSKRIINFNYYNKDKSLMYSWIIDGSKLKDTNDFITTVSFDSENKKDMLRLSNYADGLFIGFKQTNNLPTGTKIKLYVGNKYEDNDLVNIYAYVKNNDKLELVKNKIKVENGYIEFDVVDAYDYLVTMSTILNSNEVVTSNGKSSSIVLLVIISIIVLLIIELIILFILKRKKSNKDDKIIFEQGTSTITNKNYENLDTNNSNNSNNYNNPTNNYSSYNNSNFNSDEIYNNHNEQFVQNNNDKNPFN